MAYLRDPLANQVYIENGIAIKVEHWDNLCPQPWFHADKGDYTKVWSYHQSCPEKRCHANLDGRGYTEELNNYIDFVNEQPNLVLEEMSPEEFDAWRSELIEFFDLPEMPWDGKHDKQPEQFYEPHDDRSDATERAMREMAEMRREQAELNKKLSSSQITQNQIYGSWDKGDSWQTNNTNVWANVGISAEDAARGFRDMAKQLQGFIVANHDDAKTLMKHQSFVPSRAYKNEANEAASRRERRKATKKGKR